MPAGGASGLGILPTYVQTCLNHVYDVYHDVLRDYAMIGCPAMMLYGTYTVTSAAWHVLVP